MQMPKLMVTMTLLAPLVLTAVEGLAAPDAVTASSFGWNPTNATKCLQAAFDSGAKKIVVDRQPGEWLVDTVKVRSDTEVVFADGVVVRALPDSMHNTLDCLFRLKGVSNVVFRGEGKAVLKMNRRDYLDTSRYTHSEHRHCVSLYGAENVVLRNLTLAESGGDGVYLLHVRHALLENLDCVGNLRQGTSVISVDDVTIRNCVFRDTCGTLPECGMDIEPGRPTFKVGRVRIENCQFVSNNCTGVAINVGNLTATNVPLDVVYRDCEMVGNAQRGLWCILGRASPVKGRLLFERCRLAGNRVGPLQVNNLASDALHVIFRGCTFDCAGMRRNGESPLQFVNGGVNDDLNHLRFEGCRLVNAPIGVAPVSFGAMTGYGVLPGGAEGVLEVVREGGAAETFDFATLARRHPPKPELRRFETGFVEPRAYRPANPEGRAAGPQRTAGYRGPFTFLQYVQRPGTYSIDFTSTQVNKKTGIDIVVEVFDAYGTPHDTFTITTPTFRYDLKAQSKNSVYRFEVRPNGRRVSIESETPGQGIVANRRVHWLTGRDQSIYFEAKAGAEDVKVELTMAPGEWASAELVAPDGRVVDRCVRLSTGVILGAKRPKGSPSEIWSLHVTKFIDDCNVRLGSGTAGVYAYDPALLLVEKTGDK